MLSQTVGGELGGTYVNVRFDWVRVKGPQVAEVCYGQADPQMWHGWTRARNAHEYLLTTEALCAEMPSIDFPFICFHGEIDTMTDPEGSKKLFEEAQVLKPS